MTMRTTKSTVIRPFRLGTFGEQLPAGRYPVETDEGLPEGMSFSAYRPAASIMQLMPDPLHPGITEIAVVDREHREEALTMDGMQVPASDIDPPKIEP